MKKHKFWYGFLEAGKKCSPVLIDRVMNTGENSTIFIYNHNKKEILKYVRELVEPKLRELTAQEKALEASMKKGFMESLKTCKHKIPKPLSIPMKNNPAPLVNVVPEQLETEIGVLEGDDDWVDTDD